MKLLVHQMLWLGLLGQLCGVGLAQSGPIMDPIDACNKIAVPDYVVAQNYSQASPDHTYAVCVKEDREDADGVGYTDVYFSKAGKLTRLHAYKDIGPSRPIQFAPDSHAFAFNWTGGGAGGIWHVDVFDARSKILHAIDESASNEYLRRVGCNPKREDANRDLLKWLDNRSIVIRFEVDHPYLTKCCKDKKSFCAEVYLIAVPSGRILKRYAPDERNTLINEWDRAWADQY